jgi:hypothetical protein
MGASIGGGAQLIGGKQHPELLEPGASEQHHCRLRQQLSFSGKLPYNGQYQLDEGHSHDQRRECAAELPRGQVDAGGTQ